MKKPLEALTKFSNAALGIIKKWWRPILCICMAAAVYVHGVYLPMKTQTPADLTSLVGVVTAILSALGG